MLYIIILLIISGCSSTKGIVHKYDSGSKDKSGTDFNYSCSGKGKIISTDYNSLSFKYKSKTDSTFIQFLDPLGRKTLLMWITPNSIIARNLIENKQYDDLELKNFIPMTVSYTHLRAHET